MSEVSFNQLVDALKKNVKAKGMIDVSSGVEKLFGVSRTKFRNALTALEGEGYQVYLRPATQIGTEKQTFIKVLASSDAKYKDAYGKNIHPVEKD